MFLTKAKYCQIMFVLCFYTPLLATPAFDLDEFFKNEHEKSQWIASIDQILDSSTPHAPSKDALTIPLSLLEPTCSSDMKSRKPEKSTENKFADIQTVLFFYKVQLKEGTNITEIERRVTKVLGRRIGKHKIAGILDVLDLDRIVNSNNINNNKKLKAFFRNLHPGHKKTSAVILKELKGHQIIAHPSYIVGAIEGLAFKESSDYDQWLRFKCDKESESAHTFTVERLQSLGILAASIQSDEPSRLFFNLFPK